MTDEYDSFDAKHYELLSFKDPRIGDVAPDFVVRRLDRREVRLSDYRVSITVLQARQPGRNRLQRGLTVVQYRVRNYPAFE